MRVGLSVSTSHPSLEKQTAKKAPQKAIEESTERKREDLHQILKKRKREIAAEEQQAKQSVKLTLEIAGRLLQGMQLQLEQALSATSLRLFEQIEKLCETSVADVREKDVEAILEYNLVLNVTEEREIRSKLQECIYVLPLPNDPCERMTKQKYQEIIDRLRRKLEGHILLEQKVKEDRRELEREKQQIRSAPKQLKSMVFVERYEQENVALKEQNMKLINSTLELTQNNNVLKEKLQQLDDERKQLTERLHRASSTSQKLEAKLNMPDRKLLEENRNLQRANSELQQEVDRVKAEMLSTREDSLQIANRLMTISAESHSNRSHAEQLKQQLESELTRAVEQRNKHEHLHNLYKLLQDEKEDLLRSQGNQSQQNAELRQLNSQLTLALKRAEEDISSVKKDLAEEIEAKTQIEKSIWKAEESRVDFRELLERESELKDSAVRDKQLLMDRVSILEGALENLRKEKSKLQQQKTQYESSLAALRTENLSILASQKAKEVDLTNLRTDLTTLQNELASKNSKIETAKKKQQLAKKYAEEKQELEASFIFKVDSLAKEVSSTKSEFEAVKDSYEVRRKLHELRCKAIKERFAGEVIGAFQKQLKKQDSDCVQLAERLVESFSNLIHKESIIARLKEEKSELGRELQELKSKFIAEEDRKLNKTRIQSKNHAANSATKLKPRVDPDRRAEEAEVEIKQLSSSLLVQRATLQKGQAEQRVKIAEQRLATFEARSKKLEHDMDSANNINQELTNRLKELEKRTRSDREQSAIRNLQESVVVEQQQLRNEVSLARNELEGLRRQRDEFREDAARKKQYLATLKKDLKELEGKHKQLQMQLDEQKQEHNKCKKALKEYQRREQAYRENKEKMDGMRVLERQNAELKRIIDERAKQYKQEVTKKDGIIRLLKEKQACSETFMKESQQDASHTQMLEDQFNSQLRKTKAELERKDSLVKILKEKNQKLEDALEKERREFERKSQKEKVDIDRQTKRAEQLKLQSKKLQSELFSFRSMLKKLCRQLVECQRKPETSVNTTVKPCDLSLYSEGLSILQIRVEDLKSFLPEAHNQNINTLNTTPLRQLDRALADEQFDAAAVHQILSELVEKVTKRP